MRSARKFVVFIGVVSVLAAGILITSETVYSQMMHGGHMMNRSQMMNRNRQMMQDMMSGRLPPGISTEDLPDPDSQGAKLMVGYCTQCHNLPSPFMHTSAEWPAVAQCMFDRISILAGMSSGWMGMMRMKAPSSEQQEIIVSYLQAHALKPLGPNEIPSPGSPGAAEFKSACSQCHGLPDPKLHTADEWPAVLTRMQFNMRSMGKQVISDKEKNEIAAYLSEHAKQ